MRETDLAYAAGLFDGEGSVSITYAKAASGKRYHRLQIALTNCDRAVLLWLNARFGGCIAKQQPGIDKWREANRWQCNSVEAESFLRAVIPYLIIKAPQAAVALQLRETKLTKGAPGTNPMTDELEERREELRQRMKALNKRGA